MGKEHIKCSLINERKVIIYMAYLKKEYRILMERIDKELKMPQGWYFFVKKQTEKQNFIIKTKGKCKYTCSNCNTEFESNKKINEYDKCPKCHNTYLIKQSNYSFHIFEDVLVFLDRLEDKWIIRLFEIFTRYTKNEIYHSKPAEYGRIIINEETKNVMEFANDRAVNTMWGELVINHTKKGKKWRWYDQYYRSLNTYGKVYDKNLEELFKNTELKYSQLWKIAKENDELDIKYHLLNNFYSTELLAKMGLYKLAVCSGNFNKGKSFKERFGVDKSYYEFMKKNNIDNNELNILKVYKKPNIENIKILSKFNSSDLEKVKKYVSIEKFVEYSKKKRNFDIQMYIDYLGFLENLKIDIKNKKYLFPENLKKEHDEYSKQILIKNNAKINRKINKRYKQLKENTYSNTKYVIMPAKSFISLEDESTQQNHCIRNYAEKYANGKCDIYFMREINTPNKSLVTIEVKENKIVQSRTKDNGLPNNSQKRFLNKWENEILSAA